MIEYQKHPTKAGRFTLNRVLLGRRKICLKLGLENNLKGLIFNFQNIYYLANNFCNLVSLKLMNNSNIFYNNKLKNLYQIISKKVLIQAKY